jgi:DNA-binding NtrC family response regulator
MENILIIDDDRDVRMTAHFLLSRNGYQVQEVEHPSLALTHIQQQPTDLIMLDMNFNRDTTSGQEGLAFLKKLAELSNSTPVIIMTAWPTVSLAVEAMKLGARDFVEKPWDNTRLLQVIKQQLAMGKLAQKNRRLDQHNKNLQQANELIWQSDAMTTLFEQIDSVAQTDATILLTGENGTGKSSIAQYIHNHSLRSNESFVSVNMGSIPENLFESELFGHTKGAFTDAKENRIGRFELAEQGTLFLDEIGAIPLSQQAKLLRVLENGEYERVGSSKTQLAKVRLISASNTQFSQRIADSDFRQDLYYRLNTVEIRVPSLGERRKDIIPLAKHFIIQHGKKYGKPQLTLVDNAINTLLAYSWPGNVRELSHIIERAVLFSKADTITAENLSLTQQPASCEMQLMPLEQAEVSLIKQALAQTNGNTAEAADLLEISLSAMYRRMEKHDISAK